MISVVKMVWYDCIYGKMANLNLDIFEYPYMVGYSKEPVLIKEDDCMARTWPDMAIPIYCVCAYIQAHRQNVNAVEQSHCREI